MKEVYANLNDLNLLQEERGLLFRGQADSSWKIYPSIYRKFIPNQPLIRKNHLEILEKAGIKNHQLAHFLLKNFRSRLKDEPGYEEYFKAIPEREHDSNLWAYIQHYWLGTPYTDWTESFAVSLLFALFASVDDLKKINLDDLNFPEVKTNKTVSIYTLQKEKINSGSFPVLIDPTKMKYCNKRMINQNAVLLYIINDFFVENSSLSNHLIKYNINYHLACEHLSNLIKLNKIKEKFTLIINDFNKSETFSVESETLSFLKSFQQCILECVTDPSGIITTKSIDQQLESITQQKSKPGFNPENLIGIGTG